MYRPHGKRDIIISRRKSLEEKKTIDGKGLGAAMGA